MSSIHELGAEFGRIEHVKKVKKINAKYGIEEAGKAENIESTVKLSNKSISLESITKTIKDLPEIEPSRAERLQQLKQEIKNGTYKIDQAKINVIADRLLQNDDLGLGLFN